MLYVLLLNPYETINMKKWSDPNHIQTNADIRNMVLGFKCSWNISQVNKNIEY